jgi:TatD DNase family protein
MQDFDQDRGKVIQRAKDSGLAQIVTVGIDFFSSRKALHLAEDHACVYAAVGSHPHHAGDCRPDTVDHLAELASHRKVVAWGEIGLDFYRNAASRESQLDSFRRQMQRATDLNLPMVIHDREAHGDVLAMVRRAGRTNRAGVIHCFSGDLDLAMEFIGLGYYISIPGTVTYPQAVQVKKVAEGIPMDAMVLETDAPFLAPVPKRGRRNEPAFVSFTAQEVARLRKSDPQEVGQITSHNAVRLFCLPEAT